MLIPNRTEFFFGFVSVVVAVGCGEVDSGSQGVCGPGTFPHEGQCVPFDPSDTQAPTTTATPSGGPFVIAPELVVLEVDEPATIYFTTDGSDPTTESESGVGSVLVRSIADGTQLKYFAVDPAGNQEALQTQTYFLDSTLPGEVADLSAVENASALDVSWSNPGDDDFAGVLVVRAVGGADPFVPEPGTRYDVGQTVGPGQQVVFADTGTSFTDDDALPGFNTYLAYAYDTAGNYGRRVFAFGELPVPASFTATLSVQLSPLPEVTITQQPLFMKLSATARYDFDSTTPSNSTLTVSLTIENRLAKMLFNPKVVVRTTSQGTLTNGVPRLGGGGPLQIDGKPFVYYGPEALGILAEATKDLIFTGVDGTIDPVTIDINIISHPLLVTGEAQSIRIGDSFPSGLNARIACSFGNSGNCNFTEAVFNKDGSRLYLGDGRRPWIVVVDPATLSVTNSPALQPVGFIDSVSLSPDGQFVYAVLNTNTHRSLKQTRLGSGSEVRQSGGSTSVILYKLDSLTLEVVDSVVVHDTPTGDGRLVRARGHRLSLTSDGRFGALAIKNVEAVFHIDLDQMLLLRRVVLPVNPNPEDTVRYAAISPDNSEIYVVYRQLQTRLDVINTSTYVTSQLPYSVALAGTSIRPGDMLFGPDGRLYLSIKGGISGVDSTLSIYDPVRLSWKSIVLGRRILGLDFTPDGTRLLAADRGGQSIRAFAIANDVEIDQDGDASNGTTPIPSGFHRAHSMVISP